ncbi:MAG: Asp-tRNA(Asn)/Glu-tRNA(Gln) amidotransferase subunit GatC [Patescibacteria group bacterium]
MPVTKQEIKHLAELARLKLTEQETTTLTYELEKILNYVVKVNELKITKKSKPATIKNSENLRADEVILFKNTATMIEQAKSRNNNLIEVPPVFKT